MNITSHEETRRAWASTSYEAFKVNVKDFNPKYLRKYNSVAFQAKDCVMSCSTNTISLQYIEYCSQVPKHQCASG